MDTKDKTQMQAEQSDRKIRHFHELVQASPSLGASTTASSEEGSDVQMGTGEAPDKKEAKPTKFVPPVPVFQQEEEETGASDIKTKTAQRDKRKAANPPYGAVHTQKKKKNAFHP